MEKRCILHLFTPAAILCILCATGGLIKTASAQGSSMAGFTYQGRLNDTGGPATGIYDLRFEIYDLATGGSAVSGVITNGANGVSNGLFTVKLDFGAGVFTGAERWLEIGVRTNGGGSFVTLSPRQPITTTPYAIRAQQAANLSDTLPLAQLPAGVVTNNGSGVVLSGTFAGNGAALTNVNAATLGGVGSGGFWKTNGNVGANPTNGAYFGTADNLPLELRVNGVRALRLEAPPSGATGSRFAPNVVGGWSGNYVTNGAAGATVWGGASNVFENVVAADFGTVSGGRQNTAGAAETTVAGGRANSARGGNATISGGYANTINPGADYASVGGGSGNLIDSNAVRATVGGGFANTVAAPEGTVAGGAFNKALKFSSTVGGGGNNAASGEWSTIAGGRDNVLTNADYAVIGGGVQNVIQTNAAFSTLSGGGLSVIRSNAVRSTIGGGWANTAGAGESTVAGGAFNSALGFSAAIGGGGGNSASGEWSTIAGGRDNSLSNAPYATIGGGVQNTIQSNGFAATVPGGWLNSAADFGFAAGRRAKADHTGAFVWADSSDADFTSTGTNQFLIRASGGVGINNNNPNGAALAIGGDVNVEGIVSVNALSAATVTTPQLNTPHVLTPRIGTTSSVPVELFANDQRGLRVEGTTFPNTVNVIGGSSDNYVRPGTVGATIGGGGGQSFLMSANSNSVEGSFSTVSGGAANTIQLGSHAATIAGGNYNTIQPNAGQSFIGGGFLNVVHTRAFSGVIGGGVRNEIEFQSELSTIGGGVQNTIRSNSIYGTIGGGFLNTILTNAARATIGGGDQNTAGGNYATVPGGVGNNARGHFSFAAGHNAQALHDGSFVWADAPTTSFSSSGSNQFLIRATGGVGINTTDPAGAALNVNGNLKVNGQIESTGPLNLSGGGTNVLLISAINDPANGITANSRGGSPANVISNGVAGGFIGGGGNTNFPNRVGGNYASVLGGSGNTAVGMNSTAMGEHSLARGRASVAMGWQATALGEGAMALGGFTTASNHYSTAMGRDTIASGYASTAMGRLTKALNDDATAMGLGSIASGWDSVAMGTYTVAGAHYSMAAGYYGQANHQGTFVWADSTSATPFASTANDQFLLRATGGVGLGTPNPQAPLHLYSANNPTVIRIQSTGTPGFGRVEFVSNPQGDVNEWRPGYVQSVDNGGFTGGLRFVVNGTGAGNKFGEVETMRIVNGRVGIGTNNPVSALHVVGTVTATAFNPPSDRNLKENFAPVNAKEVLEKVAALPISRWNFKGDDETPHVGPMAQDFHAAFGLGTDDKHIATVDADGVALAAIQGLNHKLEETLKEKDARIARLEQSVAELKQLVGRFAKPSPATAEE